MGKTAVLHLMNGFGDSSISWIVHRLIQQSGQEKFQWHVSGLCGLGTMQEKFDQLGVSTIDFGQPADSCRYAWQRIRKYVLDHNIHIIHTHTPRTILEARLATSRIPHIIHVATKHLLTLPGDRRWGLPIALFDRLGLYLPNQLVCVSRTMYRQILAQPGIDPRRVAAICNAIPADKFHLPAQREACRRELGLSEESFAIGFAGRMEKVKRVDRLLYAHQQLTREFPESRLVLVGEGSKIAAWQSLARQLGTADRIIWTGFRTDMPRILAALDLYVVPSDNEGLSLSILEAMAAGKPVIATDVGGNAEVIINNVTGILVSPDSPQPLTAAIKDLLNQSEKRMRISQAGRDLVLEQFNVKRMTDAYSQLYVDLLSRSGTQPVN